MPAIQPALDVIDISRDSDSCYSNIRSAYVLSSCRVCHGQIVPCTVHLMPLDNLCAKHSVSIAD